MKKNLLLIAVAIATSFSAFSQDLTSKKGEKILPEAKDWAIGIDARPFFTILGNAANASAKFVNPTDQTITGKYFLNEKTAARVKLRIGMSNTTDLTLVPDIHSSDVNAKLEDKEKNSTMNVNFGIGIEKRKGNTRLQGFYGGELFVAMSSEKTTYEYGNALDTLNSLVAGRDLEDKKGGSFGLGLRGFIGAEYFILPKMSVGVEYGWGLMMGSKKNDELKSEAWVWDVDANGLQQRTGSIKETTTETGNKNSKQFKLDTDIMNAALVLTLHF